MLDTVILRLPRHQLVDMEPGGGARQPWRLQARGAGYTKYVKNPTAKDKLAGLYLPRLTGIMRGKADKSVRIEFSAPKLLFGNNLEELRDEDFPRVVATLSERLRLMGIRVFTAHLEQAEVMAFHPSKNVALRDGYTSAGAIAELGKLNPHGRMDLTKATYTNGAAIHIYSVAHSLVFYDKVADLNQPKKRAVDKDKAPKQQGLIKTLGPHTEILRVEVRLCQKRKVIEAMKKCGKTGRIAFRDVFSETVCGGILRRYWKEFTEGSYGRLLASTCSPERLLAKAIASGLKPKEAVYLVGLYGLSRSEGGIRGLRRQISAGRSERGWFRTVNDLKQAESLLTSSERHGWYLQTEEALNKMEPFRVVDKSKATAPKLSQVKAKAGQLACKE
ncbi:MAG: hypothetical protein WC497_06000 [Patescibacteria group bacterium]